MVSVEEVQFFLKSGQPSTICSRVAGYSVEVIRAAGTREAPCIKSVSESSNSVPEKSKTVTRYMVMIWRFTLCLNHGKQKFKHQSPTAIPSIKSSHFQSLCYQESFELHLPCTL